MEERRIAWEILKIALKEHVVVQMDDPWMTFHFEKLLGMMVRAHEATTSKPNKFKQKQDIPDGPVSERTLRTLLTPTEKESKKNSFPRASTLNILLKVLEIPVTGFADFVECVAILKLKPETALQDKTSLCAKLKKGCRIGDTLIDPEPLSPPNAEAPMEVNPLPYDREGGQILNESTVSEEKVEPFYKSYENAKITAKEGTIQVEIDVLPNSGYRSASLIYRGKGGSFKRPQLEGKWVAIDPANQDRLKLTIPKEIPDLPSNVSATCQVLGQILQESQAPIGKATFVYKFSGLDRHQVRDYVSVFLIDCSQERSSAAIEIEVRFLK